MAKPQEVTQPPAERSAEEWIEGLRQVVTAIEVMGPAERFAMFKYIKSRYAKDWPSDSY